MEKNRKILVFILAIMSLSIIMSIANMGVLIQDHAKRPKVAFHSMSGPGVGIVRIDGAIGFSKGGSYLGSNGGAESIIKRIDSLSKNPDIKAIVVRINSPGGTVGASEEIFQKIFKVRKANMPIVASIGEIGASGGYYAASACNEIMANHGSITGSIGVIAMSPNVEKFFEKLGIKMNVIKSGKNKDMFSSFRKMTFQERKLLQDMIDASYKRFLKDVALGRSMNQSDIAPHADGRVLNGDLALKYKLIDKIGTFEDAIERAAKLGKLDENYAIYDINASPFDQFLSEIQSFSWFSGLKSALSFKSLSTKVLYR